MSNVAIQRRKEIMSYLQSEISCDVNTLATQFKVSPATLRRDIALLEKEGLLQRTHGSVHFATPSVVPNFMERKTIFPEEKDCIAQIAAGLIHDGDTLLLDGGTSTLAILKYLKKYQNLTLITNSIAAASSVTPNISNFVLLGGQVDHRNFNTYGPYAEQMLDEVNASLLIFSTTGIFGTEALTTHSPYQASIKRKMIQRSQKHVLIVDSHKFVQSGTFRFATFSDVDVLITSKPIKDELLLQHLEQIGVKIIVAELEKT